MQRRRRRQQRRCTVADCGRPYFSTGLCESHYRKKRWLEGPRCSVPGCNRKALTLERRLCEGHDEDPTRTIRVLRERGDRVLAWGRLVIQRSSIPVLTAEAKRRGLQPTALMADVVDRWCKAIETSGWPRNSLAPCAYPGCTRPLYQRALCRTHHWQRQHGRELTPIRPMASHTEEIQAFGRLALTPELSKRLRKAAASPRIPVAELVRQILEAGLP